MRQSDTWLIVSCRDPSVWSECSQWRRSCWERIRSVCIATVDVTCWVWTGTLCVATADRTTLQWPFPPTGNNQTYVELVITKMAKDWKMCILTLVFAASVQQSTPQTSLTTPNTSSVVAHNDSATATGINQMSNTTMPDGDRSAKVNSSTATTHGTQATTTSAGQAGQGTTTPANHQGANQDLNEPVSHSLTVSSGSDAVQSSTAQILLPVPELIAVTEHAEVFIPDIPLVAVSAHAEGPYTLPPTEVFPVLNQPDDSVQESSVLSPPSPFEIVQEMFTDFESQVVALHIELCGNKCLFPYGGHTLKAIGCAKCFCDALCHIYGDCCPDLQLISSLVNESESSTTLSKQSIPTDIDTCEKSHLKTREDENDYDNYFSMVNYCPETDTSDNPSLWNSHTRPSTAVTITPSGNANPPVQTPQTLRDQCENMGNSSQRQYLRPLYSANGVVYRNQYCAQCHGEHSDNLTAWTTSVTCDADLLKTATSAAGSYGLPCTYRFKTNSDEARGNIRILLSGSASSKTNEQKTNKQTNKRRN